MALKRFREDTAAPEAQALGGEHAELMLGKIEQNLDAMLNNFYKTLMTMVAQRMGSTAGPVAQQAGVPQMEPPTKDKPWWSGMRGFLRWLWYGKHRDNPDYQGYKLPESSSFDNYLIARREAARYADYLFAEAGFEAVAVSLLEYDMSMQDVVERLKANFRDEFMKSIRPVVQQLIDLGYAARSTNQPRIVLGQNRSPAASPMQPGPQPQANPTAADQPAPQGPDAAAGVNPQPQQQTAVPVTAGKPKAPKVSKKVAEQMADYARNLKVAGATIHDVYNDPKIQEFLQRSQDSARISKPFFDAMQDTFHITDADLEPRIKELVDKDGDLSDLNRLMTEDPVFRQYLASKNGSRTALQQYFSQFKKHKELLGNGGGSGSSPKPAGGGVGDLLGFGSPFPKANSSHHINSGDEEEAPTKEEPPVQQKRNLPDLPGMDDIQKEPEAAAKQVASTEPTADEPEDSSIQDIGKWKGLRTPQGHPAYTRGDKTDIHRNLPKRDWQNTAIDGPNVDKATAVQRVTDIADEVTKLKAPISAQQRSDVLQAIMMDATMKRWFHQTRTDRERKQRKIDAMRAANDLMDKINKGESPTKAPEQKSDQGTEAKEAAPKSEGPTMQSMEARVRQIIDDKMKQLNLKPGHIGKKMLDLLDAVNRDKHLNAAIETHAAKNKFTPNQKRDMEDHLMHALPNKIVDEMEAGSNESVDFMASAVRGDRYVDLIKEGHKLLFPKRSKIDRMPLSERADHYLELLQRAHQHVYQS